MAKSRTRTGGRRNKRPATMVFERRNYQLLILGLVMVAVGYIVMRVDNQVDGFISLYVAPLLLLGGYLEIVYAILWRPKDSESRKPANQS